MTEIYEIPECKKLIDEMFAEWDKIPSRTSEHGKDLRHEREGLRLQSIYLPKIMEAARKFMAEHPEDKPLK